jgi:DNA-binding transcriptional LysR family regulator
VLDQQQLQTFVSIAQAGSIAAGLRTEAISPSLASRRIAALEAVLGVRLFQRTTRKFKMTWPATQGPSLCVQLRGM